jgi:F-type H+-transporting ATPase subunit epsilon
VPLDLTIVTPEGEAFHGPVDSVVLPGEVGDFGVLPGHERLLAALREGSLEVRNPNPQRADISEGFAEVSDDRVVVLVDRCRFGTG